jgi:epoxyqueuosine reductase
VGKNTCIINQGQGSWLFLGVILTSAQIEPDIPAADRCGTCTRCIDACPTGAFAGPYQLDARRCISYLTIEKKGEIAADLRDHMGNNIFGCDICQDVCPWNRKAPFSSAPEFQPRPGLVNPILDRLAELEEQTFQQTFRQSPLRRAKFSGMRRNIAIAMGNSGNRAFAPVLERLVDDPDRTASEAAQWALNKLKERATIP